MDKKTLIPCKYNVFLRCSTTEKIEQGVVRFESTPGNILDVKKQIEKQFSIPVCVQVISYEGYTVKGNTLLTALRVRDGDTFSVKYLEKGDCVEVDKILDWMKLTVEALQQDNSYKNVEMSYRSKHLLFEGINCDFVKNLAFEYFYPWLDPVICTNKLHFVYHGGVKILMDLHTALNYVTWEARSVNSQLTEFYLLRAIWNLTETFPLRRAICKRGGIEMCIQSMLRCKQEDDYTFRDLTRNDRAFDDGLLLRDTIVGGLGALCNLSELPEYHMTIASNEGALQQMVDICASPYMPLDCTNYVAVVFLCLAYTSSTHPLIGNPLYLRKLLDAINIEKDVDYQVPNHYLHDLKLLLRYYVLLFLAQVCLMSPQCIPKSMYQEIISEISSLLQNTWYRTVQEVELKLKYLWSTYISYVKLAYIPNTPLESNPDSTMYRLQMWCLELVVFALQNMLGRENHREFLVKEGLLDFVLCMPQYVPPNMRLRAAKLVQIVTSSPDISQRPPKLLNIVKACLAKMHFGLENVLSMSVSEIVSKVTNF